MGIEVVTLRSAFDAVPRFVGGPPIRAGDQSWWPKREKQASTRAQINRAEGADSIQRGHGPEGRADLRGTWALTDHAYLTTVEGLKLAHWTFEKDVPPCPDARG